MRLTRRGWGALALVAVCLALGAAFGQRSLNAVVAPTLVALAAAAVLVRRAEPPTVSYAPLASGFPGQTRRLRMDVEGSGVVTVAHSFPDGVAAPDVDAAVTPPRTIERDIELRDRGVYDLGPPTVRQRDPLGLIERRAGTDAGAEAVVYPAVYTLARPVRTVLFGADPAAERGSFDRLREYVPGDSLRDVHWKSSAKRDELLVVEFSSEEREGTVSIAAEARPGHADEMAAAAATLAAAALEDGLSVELTLADDHLPAGTGERHRGRVLDALARAGPGPVPSAASETADVLVRAGPDGTVVRTGGRDQRFGSLIGERRHADREVVA
jgi:uncharacterized protein (DUF58 family)